MLVIFFPKTFPKTFKQEKAFFVKKLEEIGSDNNCVLFLCVPVGLDDLAAFRGGGVYIPPFKLKRIQKKLEKDKNDKILQRFKFEALRKTINGLINKV